MKALKHLFAFALFLCPAISPAQTTLITPWDHGAWLITPTNTLPLYGPSELDAAWGTIQWGNTVELAPYQPVTCAQFDWTTCFSAISPYVTANLFTDNNGVPTVDFTQDGRGLDCLIAPKVELDTGMAAINGRYPGYPQAVVATANLGVISSLTLTATVSPVAFQVADTRCKVTQAAMRIAIILRDDTTRQNIYYLVRVFLFNQGVAAPHWYDNKGPAFGYDDVVTTYGASLASPGQTRTYAIDVLPQLQSIIANATNGADTNINNWTTAWGYVETHVNGDITAETRWSGFSLVAQ